MRGNVKNIPRNFATSSCNLECSDRKSDDTRLLTVSLGSSLPVFRWYEAHHVKISRVSKMMWKKVLKINKSPGGACILCTHRRTILTHISRGTAWISMKIGTLVGNTLRNIHTEFCAAVPTDSKLRRQFKIESAKQEREVRLIYTANLTTANMPSCTYSSALRGYLCEISALSSGWQSSFQDG